MSDTNDKWFSFSNFWELFYPIMFPENLWVNAQNDVEDMLYLLDLEPDDIEDTPKILDLCCGPGRHSVLLAEKGFDVTGVDLIDYHLEKARLNAVDYGVPLNLVKSDALDYRKPNFYDYIINLYTSFGYFKEEEDNQRMLQNIYDSLKPGGIFVIEIMGKENLAKVFHEKDFHDVNGVLYTVYREVIDDWSKIRNNWKVVTNGEIQEFIITHWLYSATELKSMLHAAGFSELECYGNLYGDPYDQHSRRLIIVATK